VRQPIVVRRFYVWDLGQYRVERCPTAPFRSLPQVVEGVQCGHFFTHGGVDDLVDGHALPLGQLAEIAMQRRR